MAGHAQAEDLDPSALDRCKACHEVRNGDHVIVPGGKNGPNLYGVIGRPAASLPGYAYSDGLRQAGEAGLVFDRDSLAAYAANPNRFLGDFLGFNAGSKMPLGFPDHAQRAADYLYNLRP